MIGYRAMLMLLVGAFVSVPLEVPTATPTAQAAEMMDHRDHGDNCYWIRTHDGRERVCDGGRGDWWGWEGRRRLNWGDGDGWRRIRHDDWGDCFRTPWGLACETRRPGVYRVRDRHRGDEPGLDCDLLIIEEWGFRCVDSPRR